MNSTLRHRPTYNNVCSAERKSTGEIVNGEPTYYYEKSLQLPNKEKQVLLDDREAHSASQPFCKNLLCPCHFEDQETIRFIMHLQRDNVLTQEEARAIFHGQRPLYQRERRLMQQGRGA
jgi:hypothetical protein